MTPPPFSGEFMQLVGSFHIGWSLVDAASDFAIWRFLGVTEVQAHVITSGMMFGPKARLLSDLIKKSDNPNKSKILEAFNKIRGLSDTRNILTHSYMRHTQSHAVFIYRTAGNECTAKRIDFSMEELKDKALALMDYLIEFHSALGASEAELNDFVSAALSLNKRSKTSPDNPTSIRG